MNGKCACRCGVVWCGVIVMEGWKKDGWDDDPVSWNELMTKEEGFSLKKKE